MQVDHIDERVLFTVRRRDGRKMGPEKHTQQEHHGEQRDEQDINEVEDLASTCFRRGCKSPEQAAHGRELGFEGATSSWGFRDRWKTYSVRQAMPKPPQRMTPALRTRAYRQHSYYMQLFHVCVRLT
jgi:hypothetical protein